MALTLEIVTPERVAFKGAADSVVIPTLDGQIDILTGHRPLMTVVVAGELHLTVHGKTEYLAVDRGFARVLGNVVSILTEAAIDIQAIDLSAVEEAQARAQESLEKARSHVDFDPAEVEKLESIIRFSLAQKLLKHRNY